MKKLYAGYFFGEFGWELMRWQAHLRHLSLSVDEMIVGCESGHEFLYSDFASSVYTLDVEQGIKRNMWMSNGGVVPFKNTNNSIVPSREICMKNSLKQEFVKFGKFDIRHQYDILIHARSTDNLNTGYRNWPERNWLDIVLNFPTMRIGSIGSREGALHITGTNDLRGIDLGLLADIMASSEVLLSPSSGPAHYASLCGLKHLVWADNDDRTIYPNRERYQNLWNPLNAEVVFIEGWQPDSKTIIDECEKCLSL